jgi:hypothetical protein
MSRLAIALAAVLMMGNAPEEICTETEEVEQPLDLSGEWEGQWWKPGHKVMPAGTDPDWGGGICIWGESSKRNYFDIHLREITETGGGRFRLPDGSLGLYRQELDRVRICIRRAGKGYPESVDSGKGEDLIVLRRVKPSM